MAKSLFSQLYFIDNFMLNEWGETGNPVLKQEQGLSVTYALGYILYKEFKEEKCQFLFTVFSFCLPAAINVLKTVFYKYFNPVL